MDKFNPGAGLCHFVFANEDIYMTDSLMRLNFRQYLYVELKKLNYRGVYVLARENERLKLTVTDAASMGIYAPYKKKSTLSRLFGDASIRRGAQQIIGDDPEDLLGRLVLMLENEKRLAVICTDGAMNMLGRYPKYVERLHRIDEHQYKRNHMLITWLSTAAEESLEAFADRDGIFQSVLFPEIRQIFARHQNVCIYDRLSQVMRSRVFFYNLLEADRIRRHVESFVLSIKAQTKILKDEQTGGLKDRMADDMIDVLTAVIHAFYHSQLFRESFPDILPDNPYRSMQVIESWLADQKHFERLMGEVKALRREAEKDDRDLAVFLREKYPEDSYLRLIYEDVDTIDHLKNIHPKMLLKSSDQTDQNSDQTDQNSDTDQIGRRDSIEKMEMMLAKVRRRLMSPCVTQMSQQTEDFMNICVDYLRGACVRKDIFTARKVLKALDDTTKWRASEGVYGTMSESEQKVVFENQRDFYTKIINAAERLGTIRDNCRKLSADIKNLRGKKQKAMEAVEDFNRRYPWVEDETRNTPPGHPVSAEVLMLTELRGDVVKQTNAIKACEYTLAQSKGIISQFRENIQKMELAVSNALLGDISHLQENLQSADQAIQMAFIQNNMLLNGLEDMPQTHEGGSIDNG